MECPQGWQVIHQVALLVSLQLLSFRLFIALKLWLLLRLLRSRALGPFLLSLLLVAIIALVLGVVWGKLY